MPTLAAVLAQFDPYEQPYDPKVDAVAGGIVLLFVLVGLALGILVLAAQWTVYKKAGEPGWAAIIPIYRRIVLCRIVHRPMWWVVLFYIPFANLVAVIVTSLDLAKAFGKDVAWGIGLILLPFIFYPMLAWGQTAYDPGRLPAPVA